MARPLPISDINTASLMLYSQNAVAIWQNPPNPALGFLYNKFVQNAGYTPMARQLPIAMDVLHVPVAAEFANPRMALPTIDGNASNITVVNSFPLNVPLTGSTIDEWEDANLIYSTLGLGTQKNYSAHNAEILAGRMMFAEEAMRNRFEVMTLDMIENARIAVTGNYTAPVSNVFTRNTVTTVAQLDDPNYSVANLVTLDSGNLRWVEADNTMNTAAHPVENVQQMIACQKRFGAGGASGFVMSPLALKAYQTDFETNYKDLATTTLLTMGGNVAFELPTSLMQIGWSLLGYVHDRANNWQPLPVYGGSSIQYRDWADSSTNNDFLPTAEEFCFPIPKVPVIAQKFTYVDLAVFADVRAMYAVNVWNDPETKETYGKMLHRGYLYPSTNPNAMPYWIVG